MLPFIQALLAGVVVGVLYALIKVRSPAPPLIGLTGLAGMLIAPVLLAALT